MQVIFIFNMNVRAYLNRIAYAGPITPDANTLRQLHLTHLMAVPFENLDIHNHRSIIVGEDAFFRKIVEQNRGGFCYELNGAFAALLRALGFKVILLSARVPRADGSPGIEFDHLTLRVDLEEPWLADVGFGDSFLEPLRLQVGNEQPQRRGVFRIVESADGLLLQRREGDEPWKAEYNFTLTPRQLQDFAGGCHYHQTSPDSPFTRKRICSIASPDGRVTLSDMKLIVTKNGRKEERIVETEEEWRALLKEHFNVVLDITMR
ncbi:MAG TPA: arylamine N-acetyltransferase [Terriglobales bacterium]|nr:arylamine N-acetyltransferase [Terriglobales bacterium]